MSITDAELAALDELDWLARDIARSARKNWWDELTWKPEYWLKAAKEATCPKN